MCISICEYVCELDCTFFGEKRAGCMCCQMHADPEISVEWPPILELVTNEFFTIGQSDPFLSDYLTDLKLHRTK